MTTAPKLAPTLEAKRVDAAHAVIYGYDGMLLAKMAANERAFERAQFLVRAAVALARGRS